MRNRANVILSSILVCAALLSTARPASTQCILDPNSPGHNGQTRLQNFYTLVDDLYSRDFEPTHRAFINGRYLQVPPWYELDHRCDEANLQNGFGVTSTHSQYLLNGDQFSELAVVTALANDENRMLEIHHTIEELKSPLNQAGNFGLPCWIAEVNTSTRTIRCLSTDTATDITARLGLAYYYATHNPEFSSSSRALFRDKGDDFAERHLQNEYVHNKCHVSSVTGKTLCEWVGGGRNTTAGGVLENAEMWIGYYQDIALFLLAAYESTGEPKFLNRAEEVVDQFLIASEFDGVNLTFGSKKFSWNTSVVPIAPIRKDAWDDSDAPRALWIGHVLRAATLSTGGAPLTGSLAELSEWVRLLHASGTQTATESCIQYTPTGGESLCGTDYYYNGLGAGLHTYHQTDTLDDKLGVALSQYGWTTSKTWNWLPCFGIYRGIRPVKALAAVIGLDSTTYGGISCLAASSTSFTLTVSKTGSGSGTVTSSPSGINCGSDCSEAYGTGTAVTLTASPAAGSTFPGWSGACSGTGSCQVTMDAAKSVTAGFGSSGSIPMAPTWLRVDTVSQNELKLTWQDNSNNEAGFKVERKEGCCGPWTLLQNASANSTTTAIYQSTGLKCGTSYAYRVWAYNSTGESAKTHEAAKMTSACN